MAATIRVTLERHLEVKMANRPWLEGCLSGKAVSFPYRPSSDVGATVSTKTYRPAFIPLAFQAAADASHLFVVNTPMGVLPAYAHSPEHYQKLLQQVRDESFGTTAAQSKSAVKQRVAVVLGINQMRSLDGNCNRAFIRHIQSLPRVAGIVQKTFGFFWDPKWRKESSVPSEDLYKLRKAYLLLKCLDPEQAATVRVQLEQPNGRLHSDLAAQIPYQLIRERIKNAEATRRFLDTMETQAPNANIYYTTLDDDSDCLRPTRTSQGVFSRLEQLIVSHNQPSIASLGYQLAENEAPLLKYAVEIDMAVRAAMSAIGPYPYVPEPCMAVKVRRPGQPNFLQQLTFVGPGTKMESRRFIRSGRDQGLLNDGLAFGREGVVTRTPARMITETNQVRPLTLNKLKTKASLAALRSRVIQSHAFPKQWAEACYEWLQFKAGRVTNVTEPMMRILRVFDPFARIEVEGGRRNRAFDKVMGEYGRPLTDAEKSVLAAARGSLVQLGMPRDKIDLIEQTARNTGAAIHVSLQKIADEL